MAQFHPPQFAMVMGATQQQHHHYHQQQQQPNGRGRTAGILGINGNGTTPLNEASFVQVCL